MSDSSRKNGHDKQTKDENTSDDAPESLKSNSKDTGGDTSEYEPLFDSVDDVDSNQETVDRIEQENKPASDQPPAATALNELAQGESLTEVLTVALQEWREMQQISRQRDEAEFAFQRSVIIIGALAFGVVIVVSGILSFTGNLPGSSFAFILGTLFGSLATILQSFLGKHQPDE
ncbi:hypothetical protein V5735_13095 (plasmid) [Haladaptatus sp. SPP-AMP-3]|uniref:hypothetical protein n=1 Tax=Haladaptatus sp. SPP-AMP-3 TaxID=3121295 RepID=UPI003C2D1559